MATDTSGIKEFSDAGFIITYFQKYFLALLCGAIASIAPYGFATCKNEFGKD